MFVAISVTALDSFVPLSQEWMLFLNPYKCARVAEVAEVQTYVE